MLNLFTSTCRWRKQLLQSLEKLFSDKAFQPLLVVSALSAILHPMPLFPCWQCHAWSGCELICEMWLPWAPACVFSPASSVTHLFALSQAFIHVLPTVEISTRALWLILDPTTCICGCFQLHRRKPFLCPCSVGFISVKNTLNYVNLCYCLSEESIPPTKPTIFILFLKRNYSTSEH